MRALPIQPDAQIDTVARALQDWLANGARSQAAHKPSAWHLAQKAVVLLYPDAHRGEVLWPNRLGLLLFITAFPQVPFLSQV